MNVVPRCQAIVHGLPRYFTGVPCKQGHTVERYTSNKTCCLCANLTANHVKAKNRSKYSLSSLEWARRNPEQVAEYQLRYTRRNPATRNKLTANYRSTKASRIPPWLSADEMWMIGQAYEIAAFRSKITKMSWHVDHIVPLRGKIVSGLHVPWNLQVIPGKENVKKGNAYVA